MKISKSLILLFLTQISISVHNEDIVALKRHLIIFADGVSKELINEKQPVINSWRR